MVEFILDTNFTNPDLPYWWPIVDDFARADATALGSTPSGARPWSIEAQAGDAANWRGNIVSGQASLARTAAPAGSVNAFAVVDTRLTGASVEATVVTLPGQTRPMVVARYVDPDNYLAAYVDGSGKWSLVQRVAGAGTVYPGSITPLAGQRVNIRYRGSDVWLYVNDANSVARTTITAHQLATKAGLGFVGNASNFGATSRFDDFKVRAI